MDAQKANYPIAVMARVFGVSTSGYYDWKAKGGKPSPRAAENAELTETIIKIHADSRGTYGAPRVRMELRLGQRKMVGRKRVARLMRLAGLKGTYRRRAWGCTKRDPEATPNPDLVRRQFDVDGPDVLWVSDVTEHNTEEGKLYLATVIDAYSRRAIGWSIADHMRSELVVDALQMALWRRRPPAGKTICHSDHGSQYTSWAFGRRLRGAGLLGSMGTVGNCFDNSLAESFFGTLQMELLDSRKWKTRQELALAIFEYLEAFYNPVRRHSSIGYLSPVEFEALHKAVEPAA